MTPNSVSHHARGFVGQPGSAYINRIFNTSLGCIALLGL